MVANKLQCVAGVCVGLKKGPKMRYVIHGWAQSTWRSYIFGWNDRSTLDHDRIIVLLLMPHISPYTIEFNEELKRDRFKCKPIPCNRSKRELTGYSKQCKITAQENKLNKSTLAIICESSALSPTTFHFRKTYRSVLWFKI